LFSLCNHIFCLRCFKTERMAADGFLRVMWQTDWCFLADPDESEHTSNEKVFIDNEF